MQNNNEEKQSFNGCTDIFSIDVALREDRLIIVLKDFVEWVVYEKEYTNDDVGREIHRKVDLGDVYASFSRIEDGEDKGRTKESLNGVSRLKHYRFGQVVQCNGVPCYKVERGGRVTSYLTMVDKKINKEVVYESQLVLNKIRHFTEAEIDVWKSAFEKKDAFEQLLKQI